MNKKFRVSNEEASKVVNLYENAPVVARKWSNEINQINEALEGDLSYYDAVSTAILLENTSSFIDQKNMFYGGMNEATQANDVGYFKNYALNLLSAVMPNLLAPEIVSIQPIIKCVA